MNILVVDDDRALSEILCKLLADEGFNAEAAYDGATGLTYSKSDLFDAIVVDIMLPNLNGIELVRELRKSGVSKPVMLLSALSEKTTIVEGLDAGADDYLTKPFDNDEFLARIRALTRRNGDIMVDTIEFADLTLNLSTYDLTCGDSSIHLTVKEFAVMRMLMSSLNRVVSKQDLITSVWGASPNITENSAEAYISFLRKKLARIGSKVRITTLRMLGYRLEVLSEGA